MLQWCSGVCTGLVLGRPAFVFLTSVSCTCVSTVTQPSIVQGIVYVYFVALLGYESG